MKKANPAEEGKDKKPYLDLVRDQIDKTGFVLEFEISNQLVADNWTVINNRFYVDDVTNKPREIDILAYKSIQIAGVYYYTVMLISCKKSDVYDWAFLTKELPKHDPNLSHLPMYCWSNNRYVNYIMQRTDWIAELELRLDKPKCFSEIHSIEKQIFATREVTKKTGEPKKADGDMIYDSITTLTKALEYEIVSLEKRQRSQSVYNFNLVSVADTEFIELFFKDIIPSAKKIHRINYLNRFIVGNKDNFYRIAFTDRTYFPALLEDFNKLHSWNRTYYHGLIQRFFENILSDRERLRFQGDIFKKELFDSIGGEVFHALKREIKDDTPVSFYYYSKDKVLEITLEIKDDELIKYLNCSVNVRKIARELLIEYFKFDGEFVFADLPF